MEYSNNLMQRTLYALSVCVHGRFVCMLASSHFRTQTASAYNATDWGVMQKMGNPSYYKHLIR